MTEQVVRLREALSDRYAIERELGAGGMATVYLAEDLKHHRKVAVKVLRRELAAALGSDRFFHEIEIVASLHHPHILPLYDSGEASEFLYYVMPFEEGQSLREKLAKEGELPVAEAIRILRDVVDALTHAHKHNVIHRDIKPDNVMLSERHALVTDFGVAKAVSEASGRHQLTTEGVALGTPAYMAPEQAAADPHIDHRADIYAVGAVAYELLTGRPPFTGVTQQEILAAHVTQAPDPPTKYRQSVPPALERLVLKCLEKKAADRWQSAEELLPLLEALATPSGGTAPTQARMTTPMSRNRWLLVSAVVAILAVVGIARQLLIQRSTADFEPNLLAVAPFDVLSSDEELNIWGEGMMDLLSRSLDGAGPLRALSPTVAVRHWSGRAEADAATAFGRKTGAGLIVFGTIVGVGADSARVAASLLDAESGITLAELELRDRSDRMDRLADSLAVRLLGDVSRTRPIPATPMYSIGSGSPAAIKAFLKGERHYRQSDWDSATVYYEQAISLDSTFALAHRRMGIVLGWDALEYGRGSNRVAYHRLMASQFSTGLAPRESLLVAADSLFASMTLFNGDSASWPLIDRLFSTIEHGVERYPKDPELWNELGEARYHFGQCVGATHEDTRLAFVRAIELDSGYAPAYPHSITLSLMLEGPESALRTAEAYLAVSNTGYEADAARLFTAILSEDEAQSTGVQQMLDTASVDALFSVGRFLVRYPDSAEVAVRVARALLARDSTMHDLRQSLAYRGHLREAYEVMSSGSWSAPDLSNWHGQTSFGAMIEFGVIPVDSAEAVLAQWFELGWLPGVSHAVRWLAARRDTATLNSYVQLGEASLGPPSQIPEDQVGFVRWALQIGRAHLTLARGDTLGALEQLETIRQWPMVAYVHELRLTRAQLLAAIGRDAEAAQLLEQMSQLEYDFSPLDVIWVLERARVNERLGEHDKAIRDYSHVMDVWREADDILKPFVDEAREAVARLAGER